MPAPIRLLVKHRCGTIQIDPIRLGLRGIGSTSLRKTATIDASRSGARVHAMREFAGHSHIRTTELYFVCKEEVAEIAARRIQIRVLGRQGRCALRCGPEAAGVARSSMTDTHCTRVVDSIRVCSARGKPPVQPCRPPVCKLPAGTVTLNSIRNWLISPIPSITIQMDEKVHRVDAMPGW